MKKICLVLFWVAILSGCKTTVPSQNFVPRFSEYVGQTRKDLERNFGIPDMVYYEETEDERLETYLIYNTVSMNRGCSWLPNYECRTIFLMAGDRVAASFYDATTCIVP